MRRLGAVLALAWLVAACQTAVPVEEARRATATFSPVPRGFVPPPRTITDLVAALEQHRQDAPDEPGEARARTDEVPPATDEPRALAQFHFRRGQARARRGHLDQGIDDLVTAADYASAAGAADLEARILLALSSLEVTGGSFAQTIEHLEAAASRVSPEHRGLLVLIRSFQARRYAQRGYLQEAEAALREAVEIRAEMGRRRRPASLNARDDTQIALSRGEIAGRRGRMAEAERAYREAARIASGDPDLARGWLPERATASLAVPLVSQGRLVEAEIEGRRALLGTLRKLGRNNINTSNAAITLAWTLGQQGRYADAEALVRVALEVYQRVGAADGSREVGRARKFLALALIGQERWQDALVEYDRIRERSADAAAARFLLGDPDFALALLHAGRVGEALQMCQRVIASQRRDPAERDPVVVLYRGFRAVINAERGDRRSALAEFAEVTPLLLARAQDTDDEASSRTARDRQAAFILARYIRLLAEVQGTPLADGTDAVGEAFRVAEVVRGRAVERALDASAARAAAATPALAGLVRREQDAAKQLAALQGHLAALLSTAQDEQAARQLRVEVERLRAERAAAAAEIHRAFPAYAQLVQPSPATIAQVRTALRPGEAVVSIFVTAERTFVWGVPATGPVAFASTAVGAAPLEATVRHLREALDIGARTFGEIPEFDVPAAQELYRQVLEPVRSAWAGAQSLIVVPHGPLGQLPFALLPTRPATLGPEEGALFSRYRSVPWLVRTHAVTVLPSAGALVTLRSVPPGAPGRRPFVGFGDPYFSLEQAREAEGGPPPRPEMSLRSATVSLRNIRVRLSDSVRLELLPRLPDTADEIRSIAGALRADPARDVFLGRRANEGSVESLDLARYRVIAFATHGLVAGDLDGLTQPALALAAPEVAQVDGDGLLTLEKILALRLDADWVVLSACNTASGNGAGSEAVSGLGRAFFYAGARALLVSHWAVETTSARALTTDLFRRQAADARLTRARALQRTLNWMIDDGALVDAATKQVIASYAHPVFWAPFVLVGDGGGAR